MNYAALALVSSSSSNQNLNTTATNQTNIQTNRGVGGLVSGSNGISLATGHITPPNTTSSSSSSIQTNLNTNNNNTNQSNSINLQQNILNQLNAANINLANSAPSPNRQLVHFYLNNYFN